MSRGRLASLLLLLLAMPRAIPAERPSSRSILDKGTNGDMTDGELENLEGELADMQQRVHAVQQHRAVNHASTGPTSLHRNSSVQQHSASSAVTSAVASALGQASAKASSGNGAAETQVLQAALNVAVKALMEQAMEKNESTDAKVNAPMKVGKELSWAQASKRANPALPPDPLKGESKDPKLLKKDDESEVPAFQYDKILNPVWDHLMTEKKKTGLLFSVDKDATESATIAKELNEAPAEVDKKVKDMNAFVDRAKEAYVDQTKATIDHVKKSPKDELIKLKEDSLVDLDKDIAFEESVNDGLSGTQQELGQAPPDPGDSNSAMWSEN